MEIRYQLQLADLKAQHRHIWKSLGKQAANPLKLLTILLGIGLGLFLLDRVLEYSIRNNYQASMFTLMFIILTISLAWSLIWLLTKSQDRWLQRFAGNYTVNFTPAGISSSDPNGLMEFYAWPELKALETSDTYLCFYLRSDAAFVIPRSALENDIDIGIFTDKIRERWSAHPDNAGKNLPEQAVLLSIKSVTALTANLTEAARIVFFLRFDARLFRVSLPMLLTLLILNQVSAAAVHYYNSLPNPEFNTYGFSTFSTNFLLTLVAVIIICNGTLRKNELMRMLTMIYATGFLIYLLYCLTWMQAMQWTNVSKLRPYFVLGYVSWTLAAVFRMIRQLRFQPAPITLGLVAIYAFFTVNLSSFLPSPHFYYPHKTDDAKPAAHRTQRRMHVEDLYYRQPALVKEKLGALQPQRPGKTDLYFVGFAGQAEEKVFSNDVRLARNLLDRRFDTAGRSLVLLNNPDTINDIPLANRHNLEAILKGMAEYMDKQEDVLFLFLSSHGAQDHKLSVSFQPLALDDLEATQLKAMLENAGIRNRIIVVSACFSGSFLDILKDDYTLILTASSRDHFSYGCGDTSQYTYFSESYFDNALANSDSFISAFYKARQLVAAREKSENKDASDPQIHVGRHIEKTLQTLDVIPAGTLTLKQPELIDTATRSTN